MNHLAGALKQALGDSPRIPEGRGSTASFALQTMDWTKANLPMNQSHVRQVDAEFIHPYPDLHDLDDTTGELLIQFCRRPEQSDVHILLVLSEQGWQRSLPDREQPEQPQIHFEVMVQIIRNHPKKTHDPIYMTFTQKKTSRFELRNSQFLVQ